MAFESINPATGERIASYDEMTWPDVERAIEGAHEAFVSWRERSFAQRGRPMRDAARLLRERADRYARLMAQEMGKPLKDGIAETQKCAVACDYFAEHAEAFLAREPIATDARSSFVTFNPIGVVLAVMPWNFPFWQVFRFAAPTLMAGNAGVLKHASNVPGCALAIEALFRDAGFPPSLFRTLMIGSREVDAVLEHRLVRAASLTGSSAAGRSIARKAGDRLKKTVLELGGSDPYLVLHDADPEHAATVCTKGRMVNGGQSCIAAKRFLVVDAIHDAFLPRFIDSMRAVRYGDPMDEPTQIGPLARHDLRDELHRQVIESVRRGARCVLGGSIPEGAGAYYPPTVLTGVGRGMPAYDEELFGPVAAVIRVRDEDEAIAVANDSAFGLGAAVLTRDVARGERIAADRIESGCVFVNDSVRSDARLPFGGVKESGYGRELSAYGIREFVNIKTVYVAAQAEPARRQRAVSTANRKEVVMPEKKTLERARKDKREGKSPSTQAGEFVREEIEHVREGKHGARSAEQAIAIGLSKARRAGVDLPPPRKGKAPEETRERAKRDARAGGSSKQPSAKRSRATKQALKREGRAAASKTALARHAKAAARKRTASERSAAARKAAKTRARKKSQA